LCTYLPYNAFPFDSKAMKINKNKLTSSSKFHVTLLVLRIQNTAEYKELISILQQAESIFRKYFDGQAIELQLKQIKVEAPLTDGAALPAENAPNDNLSEDDMRKSDDSIDDDSIDEESIDEDGELDVDGEQGEDLEQIATELRVTEKPLLRFQNVGHFYGSGKCIVWIGLKDDQHKVMLEHLARIL